MSFLSEFKAFAMRGNVVDLAVAVVMGAAFGKIIASLVDGIIMPMVGLMLGGINIADKNFTLGQAVLKWGSFLQAVIDFTLVAFALFLVIKLINSMQKTKEAVVPPPTQQEVLLTEIRDLLKSISTN